MKRFGMIGGLGSFASVRLYELINQTAIEGISGEVEDSSFPDLTIRQIPFRSTDKFGNVNEELFLEEAEEGLNSLVQAGVTHVSFACNTLNGLFEKAVANNGKLIYVSTVEETTKALNAKKKTNPLAVLTSRNAFTLDIYRNKTLNRPVIEGNQYLVDELIYASMQGKHHQMEEVFHKVAEDILSTSPDADILLGCTELSIYDTFDFCNKKYDSLKFAAQTIVRLNHENP